MYFDPVEEILVETHHDDFGRSLYEGLWPEHLEVVCLMIGLEEYGLEVDIAGIGIEIHMRARGALIDVLGHVLK